MILLDNTPPFEMGFSAITLYLNITKTTLYSVSMLLKYIISYLEIIASFFFKLEPYHIDGNVFAVCLRNTGHSRTPRFFYKNVSKS